jgi:cation-transporting ATPase 13A2
MTIFHCLRICRAGLSTNFHVFSMMILFSLIQYTTVTLLQANYQYLTDSQMLYEDLFVTFPIFITLNMTKASSRLSKQRPLTSFFDKKALVSMIGQLVLQFLAQLSFILYLLTFEEFQ